MVEFPRRKPNFVEKGGDTMSNVLIIGVAGGSGSGKSTLINNLEKEFGESICVMRHDNYYRAHDLLTLEERTRLNYDHPDAYETDLMVAHLKELKEGHSILCPQYDFAQHNRTKETLEVRSAPVILVDGILILADPALRELMDIKVFVDTDADVRLTRRILRDTRKRGRSVESVITQYLTTVKPMHEQFVEPSRRYADFIIPEGGKNRTALEILETRIRSHLAEEA